MNKEIEQTGYRKNAQGYLVPEDLIRPVDKLRDDVVLDIVEAAKVLRQAMADFKAASMQKIGDFIDLSSKEYGVEYGGTKGNVTLPSFDGHFKILRAVGDHRVFDERIQAAKKLIDDCVIAWSDGANDNLKALVDHAFRVNKQGRIDVNEVLGLRQVEIDDARWQEAMDAIADSIRVTGTSQYLRIYERQPNGKYEQISLDIAGV
ncbi:TPA: DUF3164 family protein [Serratia marcescens]|uniref:DUF3164 family protein n=1 Tax=Serratia TaxID=613 RepID=UPI0007454063|nr:DUF3164 family protein [Serratia marcescens]CVA12606.1 Protein of uncharacterised function (DUF3164) [Serratia marcescens]CVA90963.1 Protein of uncharacterised function (DUF3164) [Serratia marcescens]CVB31530.1 Protein of uncharacterised function (DUF3164) [Serratia marcescens]CVB56002.1 Protein of uncharacterised function (DUF3164) [Serratia marcescens]CVB92183.1 Protein of uncharacterised function (DUF3164) [Serratia marcescens]